ncbi:MAG TPA: hypothetical protein VLC98_12205 [Phnomibacter sp.]|nr:hypothetical protein [Phnomibacter sp.]
MATPAFLKWNYWHKAIPKPSYTGADIYLPAVPDNTIAWFTDQYTSKQNDPREADYIIHPCLLRDPADIHKELKLLSAKYRPFHKPVIVFTLSDYEGVYKSYKNLIILRTSAKKSLLRSNEFILPYVWESAQEPFQESGNTHRPVVGFCGLVSGYRRKLIDLAVAYNRLDCRFILHDSFWGGKPHDEQIIADFWGNMRSSQFMIASRGAGNFSMRFYQAMSMGRIPVLVDTDMELPLSSLIDWKNLIVFEKNETDCVERIMEIHKAGNTAEMQRICYNTYHQFLSEKNFLQKLLSSIA